MGVIMETHVRGFSRWTDGKGGSRCIFLLGLRGKHPTGCPLHDMAMTPERHCGMVRQQEALSLAP